MTHAMLKEKFSAQKLAIHNPKGRIRRKFTGLPPISEAALTHGNNY